MEDELSSIPTGHLLMLAREWMFGNNQFNRSNTYFIRILKTASLRGDGEATWLLEHLDNIPDFGENNYYRRKWLDKNIPKEDNPWSCYYLACARVQDLTSNANELFRRSANFCFAPAMSELYNHYDDYAEMLQKSVDLCDPLGLSFFSDLCDDGFQLLSQAVELGYFNGIPHLIDEYLPLLSAMDLAKLDARYILYSGKTNFTGDSILRARNKWGSCLNAAFVAGRELHVAKYLWDKGNVLTKPFRECVELYLKVTQRARSAALQTTFGLRVYLGRDVSRMIGKMVYGTRFTDVNVWK